MKNSYKEITFTLANMACASCVHLIENSLQHMKGIKKVNVNFATSTAHIIYDPTQIQSEQIENQLDKIGYPPKTTSHKDKKQKSTKNELFWLRCRTYFSLSISCIFFLQMIAHFFPISIKIPIVIQLLLATSIQLYGGWPFYVGAYKSLKNLRANMDTLIMLGTTTAYLYSLIVVFFHKSSFLYFDTSAMIITLVLVGKLIEKNSSLQAQSGMRALLEMQPREANILKGEKIEKIPIEQIQVGDIFIVQPGEKIPIDGEIIAGISSVDESMLTGESIPIEKKENDQIFAGTINGNGTLRAKSLRVGENTTLSHIIDLVKKAQSTKAPIQKLVDKISSFFVPLVIIISIFTFCIWWWGFADISSAISASIAVLIIACPCALGLATPVVIMVATTIGARNGILIKDPEALEKVQKVKVIMFDKTGTITEGKPKVTKLFPNDSNFSLQIMVSIAKNSTHPSSKAIIEYGKERKISPLILDNCTQIPGKGLVAEYKAKKYFMGSRVFLQENGISFEDNQDIPTSNIALGYDNKCALTMYLEDSVKEESKAAITALIDKGIIPIMLTGDITSIAEKIAKKVGITTFLAEAMPEDKLAYIQKWKNKNLLTAMVGDGINDAPALATADVGFAIAHGTDVAMENADIGLMKNSLMDVVKTLHLSIFTKRKIQQNLFFAFFYNICAIPLAALGLLNPIIAAGAMALSSISVITNASLLQKKKL